LPACQPPSIRPAPVAADDLQDEIVALAIGPFLDDGDEILFCDD
jgi:hypothetical protein